MVFNPPPGYYDLADNRSQHKQMPAFGLADRFHKQEANRNPGPGAYHNHQKDAVKKSTHPSTQD